MNIEDFALTKIKGFGMMVKGQFAKRLEEVGINNIYDFVCRSTEELVVSTKLKKESVEKIKHKCLEWLLEKEYILNPDMTPIDQYKLEQSRIESIVTSGSKAVDDLLNGGLKKGQFYTIWGSEGSGKTQFCFNQIVESIEQSGGNVYLLEVESTFRPERIIEIAINKGYAKDEEEAMKKFLSKITVTRCPDSLTIMDAVNDLTNKMITLEPTLVVIDGAIGQFRLDFIGLGNLSNRQTEIKLFVNRLKKLRQYFDIPFIMTNQVYTKVGIIAYDVQAGGHIVGHVSTCTLQIGKKGENRKLRVRKDPSTPDTEVLFKITNKGFEDLSTYKGVEEIAVEEKIEEEKPIDEV